VYWKGLPATNNSTSAIAPTRSTTSARQLAVGNPPEDLGCQKYRTVVTTHGVVIGRFVWIWLQIGRSWGFTLLVLVPPWLGLHRLSLGLGTFVYCCGTSQSWSWSFRVLGTTSLLLGRFVVLGTFSLGLGLRTVVVVGPPTLDLGLGFHGFILGLDISESRS